jgi:hypothetical protein
MNDKPQFNLEKLNLALDGKKAGLLSGMAVRRARLLPGGWLIVVSSTHGASGAALYPDAQHFWDGGTPD